MKKFILKVVVFLFLIISYKLGLLVISMSINGRANLNDYYGSSAKKPRLILVGSSNIDYNYDYMYLNEKIKKYNVIGCNLNEPSGFFSTVSKLQRLKLRSNDVVVFCLPHSFYESKKFLPINSYKKAGFQWQIIGNAIVNFPTESLSAIFIDNKIEDVYQMYGNKKSESRELDLSPRFRIKSDVETDSIYMNCSKVKNKGPFLVTSTSFEKEYIDRINKYLKKELPCRYVFRYPVVLLNNYNLNEQRLNYIELKFNFVNEFKNSIYTYEDFYNQTYHLNKCGRTKCSEKLLIELKDFL